MRVREVIPFGKSDEEMETRERERGGKKAELWRKREREADRGGDIFRVVFTQSYLCLSFVFWTCQKVASSYILR